MLAPIILFVYNRLDSTKKTVDALKNNLLAKESDLIIYSDGVNYIEETEKSVETIRNYIKTITGFKNIKIIERKYNHGLYMNITSGVKEVIQIYGKAIIVEDDIVTSKYFLTYMNDSLNYYKTNNKIYSVCGFQWNIKTESKVFGLNHFNCHGWATWEDRWDKFEHDNKYLYRAIIWKKLGKRFDLDGAYPFMKMLKNTNSWAIRWHSIIFLNNKLCVYSPHSLVKNIGDIGVNSKGYNLYPTKIVNKKVCLKPITEEDTTMRKRLIQYYRRLLPKRILNKILRILKLK